MLFPAEDYFSTLSIAHRSLSKLWPQKPPSFCVSISIAILGVQVFFGQPLSELEIIISGTQVNLENNNGYQGV